MNITIKPGLIRVTSKGKVYESRTVGYYIDGARVPLERIPMSVRYLMAIKTAGEALL